MPYLFSISLVVMLARMAPDCAKNRPDNMKKYDRHVKKKTQSHGSAYQMLRNDSKKLLQSKFTTSGDVKTDVTVNTHKLPVPNQAQKTNRMKR